MKILSSIAIGVSVLVIAFVANLFHQGKVSQKGSVPGLIDQQLQACPDKPNCVCSEYPDDKKHYIAPISVQNAQQALTDSLAIIKQMNGTVVHKNDHYIAATFTSDLFKFVDDFEVRLDKQKKLLHIRSASRVGYGDMQVNKNRAATFIELFTHPSQ